MNCKKCLEMIPFFSELSREEKIQVKKHLHLCRNCREEWKIEKRFVQSMGYSVFSRNKSWLAPVAEAVSLVLAFSLVLCALITTRLPVGRYSEETTYLPSQIAGNADIMILDNEEQLNQILNDIEMDGELKPVKVIITGG